MCLLTYKPASEPLNEQHLRNAFKNNSDGAGVAFVRDGKLVIDKGWLNFEGFWNYLQSVAHLELIIHFRAASSGMDVTKDMTHPFGVESSQKFTDAAGIERPRYYFAIAHNGRLDYRSTKEKSDTACFIEDVLGPALSRDPWFLSNPATKFMLARTIGDKNKMAIMRYDAEKNDSNCYIVNDEGGTDYTYTSSGHKSKAHWMKNNVWYSNYSYQEPITKTVTTYGYGSGAMAPYYGRGQGVGELGLIGDGDEWDNVGHITSPFGIPDANGWKWNFNKDQWENVKTGVFVDILDTRPIRPQYIVLREAAQRAQEEASSKSAQEAEGGGKIIKLEGGHEIKVPRDDDVEEAGSNLQHLSKPDRKILRRAAVDYVNDLHGKKGKRKNFSNSEMIALLRSELREMLPFLKQFNDATLDMWIVNKCRHGEGVARFTN